MSITRYDDHAGSDSLLAPAARRGRGERDRADRSMPFWPANVTGARDAHGPAAGPASAPKARGIAVCNAALVLLAAVAAFTAPARIAHAQAAIPTARTLVDRACQAAGGYDRFQAIPILQVSVATDEVTTDGHASKASERVFFRPPGPTPGRLEFASSGVVIGDDGTGGWAITKGAPDSRPATVYMVKRSISTTLFPLLLPFSLRWDGVSVTGVDATVIDGKPVWQLAVVVPKGFFSSPQIATNWTVSLDQASYAVVRAESPYVDLGRGIVADGMRYAWLNPIRVGGIMLPSEQHIVGLDRSGAERAHSRIDRFNYTVLESGQATPLFANPIPPEQRPKPPVGPDQMKPPKG